MRELAIVAEIVVLALGAALWPALVGVVLVALASPRPVRILAFFLIGGLLTTTAIGVAIVFSLEGVDDARADTGVPAAVDLAAGLVLLVLAGVARRREPGVPQASEPAEAQRRPWTERMLDRGTGRIAFVVGVVLNLVPGVVAVVGYSHISRLGVEAGTEVALVIVFNLIMFTLVEAPLVGYVAAPDWTAGHVVRLNGWLRSHGCQAIAWTAAAAGVYLSARGLAGLL
jgi:hypothetical protein